MRRDSLHEAKTVERDEEGDTPLLLVQGPRQGASGRRCGQKLQMRWEWSLGRSGDAEAVADRLCQDIGRLVTA